MEGDARVPGEVGGEDPTVELYLAESSKTVRVDAETVEIGAGGALSESGEASTGDSLPPIKGYTIESEIARGGMGTVYLATQTPPGRQVALKVVHMKGRQEETVLRFQQEVGAVAKMNHPNIITIYEVGATRDLLYYSMTLIEGETLRDAIYQQGVGLRSGLDIVRRLADALHYSHARGILHRDIKPENILIDRDGTPYITDFGLARDLTQEGRVTTTGAIAGTPLYMSPEQAVGERYLDHRTDVYSLGATLYELLALKPAFEAASIVAVLAKIASEDPPRLRSVDPRIPRDVETICEKAMRKDRNDRYTDAGAFAADIGRFLDGHPVHARPVKPHVRLWMWMRRNPVIASLTVTVAVACLAFTGYLLGVRAERRTFMQARLAEARAHWSTGEDAYASATGSRVKGDLAQAEVHAQAAEQAYLKAIEQLSQASDLGQEPRLLRASIRQRFVQRAEAEGDARLAAILLTDLTAAIVGLKPGRRRRELDLFAKGLARLELTVDPAVSGLSARGVEGLDVALAVSGSTVRVLDVPMGGFVLELRAAGKAPLRVPVWLGRCEQQRLRVRLLLEAQIPAGMCHVPAGPFFVGGSDPGARLRSRVELPGFLIDRDEVTFGQYRAWTSSLSSEEAARRAPRLEGAERPDDSLPVVGIIWADAAAYAAAVGKRLPTENEWTKAARGADPRPYAFGERFHMDLANVARPLEGLRAPGSLGDISPYGCRDMAGNVSEIVADLYWTDRPDGPRVRRGGAYALAPHYARVTYRDPIPLGEWRSYLGFRCAKDLPAD